MARKPPVVRLAASRRPDPQHPARAGRQSEQLEGRRLIVEFTLAGQEFIALNGGPHFKFTEAVSLRRSPATTRPRSTGYWDALTADGGQESQCGWLKDKYGLSWQIAPKVLLQMLSDQDPGRRSAPCRR